MGGTEPIDDATVTDVPGAVKKFWGVKTKLFMAQMLTIHLWRTSSSFHCPQSANLCGMFLLVFFYKLYYCTT